jgi:hypothetical protein
VSKQDSISLLDDIVTLSNMITRKPRLIHSTPNLGEIVSLWASNVSKQVAKVESYAGGISVRVNMRDMNGQALIDTLFTANSTANRQALRTVVKNYNTL